VESGLTSKNSSPLLIELTSSMKYGGLLKRKKLNYLRNLVFSLIIHIDSIISPLYSIHSISLALRAVYLLFPSLFVDNSTFWRSNSNEKAFLDMISLVSYFFTTDYRQTQLFMIQISLCCILMIVFISYGITSYRYKTSSKISSFVPRFFDFLNTFVFHIVLNFASSECGVGISVYIADSSKNIKALIFSLFLMMICFISIWFYSVFLSSSLVFRPISFQTSLGTPQIQIIIVSFIVNLLAPISSLSVEPFRSISIALMIVTYIVSLGIPFRIGSIISDFEKKLFISLCITGISNSVIVLVFNHKKRQGNELILILVCVVLLFSYIVSQIIVNNEKNKALRLLDVWLEGVEKIENCNNFSLMIKSGLIGFSVCHPISLDWTVFRAVINIWPERADGWILFSKFVAIYPEESSLLSYIAQQMLKKNSKGQYSKQISMQILSLIQQRESNLSSILKKKIEDVRRSIGNSKRSLRNVWDQVIQGNMDELDSAIQNSYKSIKNSNADINHMLSEFPNNRFVARLCVQYYTDVLADYEGREKWKEKHGLIKRGISIVDDHAHQFGLRCFPKLPQKINAQKSFYQEPTESIITTENDYEETICDVDTKMMSIIKERIDNMHYSSFYYSNIMLLILFIIILATISFTILYISPFIDNISKPINIVYHLSFLRSLNFQIPSFIHHLILEEVPKNVPFFDKVDLGGHIPVSFGSTDDTREQVLYLAKMVYISIQTLLKYRSIGKEDKTYEKIESIIFGQNILYTHYLASNNPIPQYSSYQLIMTDYAFQATKSVEAKELTKSMLNSSILLNPGLNCAPIAASMSTALIQLVETMESSIQQVLYYISLFCGIMPIVIIVGLGSLAVFSIKNMLKDQKSIFMCLLSIPKNIVSSLSDNLRIIRKEKSDTSKRNDSDKDTSKQEEHILKVFSSASEGSSNSFGYNFVYIFSCITISICLIVSSFSLYQLFKNICNLLLQNTPHLDHILGTSGYIVGMFSGFNNAVSTFMGYPASQLSYEELAKRAIFRIDTFRAHYSVVKFGNSTRNVPPFPQFEEEINKVDQRRGCHKTSETNITTMRERFKCYPPTLQILLVETWTQHMIHGFLSGEYKTFDTHSELFNELWYMVIFNLYEYFIFPMFDAIIPTIELTIESSITPSLLPVAICLIIMITLVIFLYIQNIKMKEKFNYSLNLLLHCPIDTLIHTPRIVNLLAGDLTNAEYSKRDSDFFDQIVNNLPDLIIIYNNQMKIHHLNTSASNFFKDKYNIGEDIRVLFSQDMFSPKYNDHDYQNQFKLPEMITITNNGSQNYFRTNILTINEYYVICLKNETQIVIYNQLIQDEKQKSDKMLYSILPPVFVKSLQSGQNNSGFLVQNASVVFIDIVGFTPWCASLTANQVMSTLNIIFREFDSIILQYPSMIKVKCIGDCYMAAGGIFNDVNNSTTHAKEAVQFGLSAIEAIKRINMENKLDIKIRIGIHSGGPIVVGVIGTKKPTFEILGPIISMAQQMEHHGVPMNVHISRGVYELIFSGEFSIRENGEKQIKDKKMLTYLVS